MQPDRYSRMIAWLKVTLPLLALGILSTLFLISRAVDPPSTIPFADTEVQERLTNQQVTGPYYSATTMDGDEIAFIAETVTTPDGQPGVNIAENVDVTIDTPSGRQVNVTALRADVSIAADQTDLTGDVVVVMSGGYILRSDLLNLRMSRVEMTSPDHVTATTPVGDLEAGAMRLFTPEGAEGSQIHFTGGVKLLYQPKASKE
ncbi:MAG: LPS export ABC transporter periplasmic protein LptC [Pseudomonadota bacterium]